MPLTSNPIDGATRSAPRRGSARPLVLAALAAGLLAGCGGGRDDKTPGASAQAGSESATASGASAPSGSVSAPPPRDDAPQGAGVGKFVEVASKDLGCAPAQFELASYLLRGELTLAGRPGAGGGEVAASWLVQLQGKAQIGFAGFDGQAKRIGRDRGIGSAREHAPHLFATGGSWTVVWFDAQGLAYARPVWETTPPPEVEHLQAVRDVSPEDTALARTPDGAVVVASPFGTQGDQLSVFLFAGPTQGDPSQIEKPRALGVTKSAKKPRRPAVAADGTGYTLVWLEEDGHLQATRLDAAGRELGGDAVAPGGADRASIGLATVEGGALLTWQEGDRILGRRIGPDARAASPIQVLGKGKHPTSISAGTDAIVSYLAEVEGQADQLVALRVGAAGPAAQAVRISDGKTPVLDPPALALAGGRLAFAWTEVMGVTISSKRAWLRTVDVACVK